MNLVVSPLSWLVVIGGTLSGGAMYTLANFAWRWKRPTAPAPEFRGRVINYLKWQVPPLLIFVIPIMGFFAMGGCSTMFALWRKQKRRGDIG